MTVFFAVVENSVSVTSVHIFFSFLGPVEC